MSDNFLIKIGFDDKLIQDIIDNNSLPIYEALLMNESDCIKIIKLLRYLGINCVRELIVNRIDIFINSYDGVNDLFLNLSTDMINNINKDYTLIDELFNL